MDLYEGLTRESPSGETLPAAAKSWQVSTDGKDYTFTLRPHLQWSNGEPLRASDFLRSWRRVLDPQGRSPTAENLKIIRGAQEIIAGRAAPDTLGVEAPADGTLIVHLARPAPYFPGLLSHPVTFPVYSETAARTHEPKEFVSNGPFVFAHWQPGTVIRLSRNGAYWDRATLSIAEVDYQISSDENVQYARFRAGELDLTDTVPSNALAELKQQSPSPVVIAPYLATAYYVLNLNLPTLGRNAKLRRALALAIDRKRVVAMLGSGQEPAHSFLPPGVWSYHPQTVDWASLDDQSRVEEAKRLYREAGYSDATALQLRVLINSNVAIRRTAVLIAAMWKEVLGVESQITEEEYRVFLQSRQDKSRWDVVRLGWVADFNDASNFLEGFRSDSVNNNSGYSNPSFDRLLDEAATTTDPKKRAELLESAERTLLEDGPIIPLYTLVSKHLVKPYVQGVSPSPLGRLSSKDLGLTAH